MISALIETTKPNISRAEVEWVPGLMAPKGARMRVERREQGKQGDGGWHVIGSSSMSQRLSLIPIE